jgi:hypothetical protein
MEENNNIKKIDKTFFNIECIFQDIALVVTDIEIEPITFQVTGVLSILDLNKGIFFPLREEKKELETLIGFCKNKIYFYKNRLRFFFNRY